MRILIVDDEGIHRESMEMLMREHFRISQIRTASSGRMGLEILLSETIDLAFVDVKMPGMDGLAMIAAYRTERPDAGLKQPLFVIVSGYGEFSFAQQALRYGVYRYLLKPVDINEISELVQGAGEEIEPHVEPEEDVDTDERFTRCLEYIAAHYMQPLSLERLASGMYFSTSYFCTLFKRKTGVSFNKYLQRIRLAHAMEMLTGTRLRVYEIAERVGYVDVKYFIRVFKNEFGVTPDTFRRDALLSQMEEAACDVEKR